MAKAITRLALLLILGLVCPLVEAATVKVRVNDTSGVGIPKILVIVRPLEGRGEDDYELTDAKGFVPSLDLSPGLYEVIAANPYGPWITKVKDFVVRSTPLELELRLEGTIINSYLLTRFDLRVQVVAGDGGPVSGAVLLARDLEAKDLFWAKTDDKGWATLVVPFDGAEVSAFYQGQVQTREVDIKSDLSACYRPCEIERSEQLKKVPRSMTIRLP